MKQTAILRIGYQSISLPAEKAIKVMQLLAGGLKVSRNFDACHEDRNTREVYDIEGLLELTVEMVRPGVKFVTPQGDAVDITTPTRPKALPAPPKAIAGPRS